MDLQIKAMAHQAMIILLMDSGNMKGVKVTADDCVDEDTGFLRRVALRHVHHVRLHGHGAAALRRVEGGDGPVVGQAVVTADDPEPDDVALVVKDLEPLRAPAGGEAGDHADLAKGTHVAVAEDHVAALHEVLVGLRIVEPPEDGPDGGHGGGDPLCDGGAALIGADGVVVVAGHVVRDLRGGAAVGFLAGGGRGGDLAHSLEEKGGFW
ncbi:DNA-directed RNA polymerase subunit omega [Striga asiatica]|uniref:DNA-directed RNA polymerase subunit omega n=1 Tax=Striga asiatica TaxID=4170 RepID=A0A5A7P1P3_STRAF|nr:DNA-directed RNA polymerase subunit omega [Striga asiatica]